MTRPSQKLDWLRRTRNAIAALLTLPAALSSCFSALGHAGPNTDHVDGLRFRNQNTEVQTSAGFFTFLRWQFTRKPGPWRSYTNAPPGPPPPSQVGKGDLRVTFINHATTLIQTDGLNI